MLIESEKTCHQPETPLKSHRSLLAKTTQAQTRVPSSELPLYLLDLLFCCFS